MSGAETTSHVGKKGHFDLWGEAKKHPYVTGVAVFGIGLVALLLFRSGGSASSGGGQDQSDAAAIAAESQYQQAQLAAASQSETVQAQLQAQLQQAQLAANATTSQVNGAVAINTANDNASTSIASIQAAADEAIAQTQAALGVTQSNNQTTLGVTQANDATQATDLQTSTQGQVSLAGISAGVTENQQNVSLFQSLISALYGNNAQGSSYTGTLPQIGGTPGTSAAKTITNTTAFLNSQPNTTLFTPTQIKQLLNG